MSGDRIHFPGNPWPEGHPIDKFEWTARRKDGIVWFGFHLKTVDYHDEREIDDQEDNLSDWESPGVWGNYHACTLSSTFWHEGGFSSGLSPIDYLPGNLDGLEFLIDTIPPDDIEDNAFHAYLLGHDAVAGHKITFTRVPGSDRFDIDWSGMIALAYTGDYEYRYKFLAKLRGIPMPSLAEE